MMRILLVGNPNCGKTALFNALTGGNQRVGNWPGVTVEKKTGFFSLEAQSVEITDLPGAYSLTSSSEGIGKDEHIAAHCIATLEADCIINVVDACHLERHLYLTSQVLELGKPVILALNMMDIAQQRGIFIDAEALSRELGCLVIPMQAHKNIGIPALHEALMKQPEILAPWSFSLDPSAQTALNHLEQQLIQEGYSQPLAYYHARRVAEGGTLLAGIAPVDGELDVVLADARYQKIHEIILLVQKRQDDAREHLTAKIDRVVLHRIWALPIFFTMMYFMFWFAIHVGGIFQDFFDISTDTIFVQGSAWLLQQAHAPGWLIAVMAHGIGKGINTTLTFIPVIAAMFFFLSLLETSGYMARAAFVVDKVMRAMGLPGKSFVPMIVGFGCNVPAIMAARTLDSERDRLLTVMMSPFMSCSARLAIYAVFVAAFFPSGGQNIVFSLYMTGILMAVLTGFILRKTTLKGSVSPLILELPAYHKPELIRLFKETFLRLRFFVLRAGSWIIPICILLGGLNAITLTGVVNAGEAHTQSLLSVVGQWITPFFAPMGLHQDNWPATVGLLTGMLAKEVVIGTLNSLYAQAAHLGELAPVSFDFWDGMRSALWSIPQHISQLGATLWNPLLVDAADNQVSQSVYGVMVQRFDGQIGAYAYLLFVLLYIPCVSTMAVVRQEANKHWMWISIVWSFIAAYGIAVAFYQTATFLEYSHYSLVGILSRLAVVLSGSIVLYYLVQSFRRRHAIANTRLY